MIVARLELQINNRLYKIFGQQIQMMIYGVLIKPLTHLSRLKVAEQILLHTFFDEIGLVELNESLHLRLDYIDAFILVFANDHSKVAHVRQRRDANEQILEAEMFGHEQKRRVQGILQICLHSQIELGTINRLGIGLYKFNRLLQAPTYVKIIPVEEVSYEGFFVYDTVLDQLLLRLSVVKLDAQRHKCVVIAGGRDVVLESGQIARPQNSKTRVVRFIFDQIFAMKFDRVLHHQHKVNHVRGGRTHSRLIVVELFKDTRAVSERVLDVWELI